jgi:O-antigen/teichoic acid export membrane protein
VPIFFGIAVTSRETIEFLLSDSWLPASLPLAILSISSIVHATNYTFTTATNALGRSDVALRYIVVIIVLRLIACLIAAQVGIVAVAFSNLASNFVTPAIVVAATNRILGGRWRYYLAQSGLALVAGLLMVAATMGTNLLFGGLHVAALLSIKIAVGIASYTLALRALAPNIYRAALSLFTGRA